MVRDRRYGGGNPSVYRDRDYSTQRRGVDMELFDRERERERDRDRDKGRVGFRGKGEYSPRRGGGGGGGSGYDRMRIVDVKYSPGRRGGDFERRRIRGEEGRRGGNGEYSREPPPSEMLSRDYNRHSDVVGRKYSPGRGGGELEMVSRRGKEEERRGGGGGDYMHEQPRERLRDYNRNSNNVDTRREYGSGSLQSYHGPDRDRNDHGRDDNSSRKFYHLDEGLSHVNRENRPLDGYRKPDGLMGSTNKGLSGVDRWNRPLDEQRKLDVLKGSSDVVGGDAGVSERDYFSRRYQLLDSNPLPLEAGKEKGYPSSYPLDVSVPPKSFGNSDGGNCGLTTAYPGTNLHKGEGYHPHPVPHPKDEYHVGSSTGPTAFASMSSGGGKDDFTTSRRGHQAPSDGVGLSSEMLNKPLLYDGYGEKLLTKPPLDPFLQSSDMRSYSQSYLIPCGEKPGSNSYPDVGRSEGDRIAVGSQGTHGSTLGVREDYSHRDILRTTNQEPIVDGVDQISRREHIRDSRPWVHHSYSRGKSPVNYVDGVGSSYVRRDDVDALGYGDTRLEYEREAYKNYGSDQPREPRGYPIGHDPWSQHDRSTVRTSGEYHDSPSRRLSPRDLSLPEPSKKILKHNSRELLISSNGRIDRKRYDDDELDPMIVSRKSRFSSSSHVMTRRFSQPMSRLSSTGGIKDRLGPRPQNVRTWHSQVRNHKSSVKNRLGPHPVNVHSSRLGNKFRSSLKKRLGPAA